MIVIFISMSFIYEFTDYYLGKCCKSNVMLSHSYRSSILCHIEIGETMNILCILTFTHIIFGKPMNGIWKIRRLHLDKQSKNVNVQKLPASNWKLNFAKIQQIASLHIIIITVVFKIHIVWSFFFLLALVRSFCLLNFAVYAVLRVNTRLALDALAPSATLSMPNT